MSRSSPYSPRTILVVDDQIGVVGSLQQKGFLRNYERLPYNFIFESCRVEQGYEAGPALQAVSRENEISLVLLDLKFGAEEALLGFEILRLLSARFPSLPVLVMSSAERDVEMLGRCLEDGAVGFVEKHRSSEHLRTAIEQAVELMESHVLLGQSASLKELRRQAARLSPYDQIPVLVVGERGTGKERVARYIHHSGPRRVGPFVAVNCAGVPDTLFESEFFGAEKGAYTGADTLRRGYLERAHGGTLFLDEVGTLPTAMQAKLLRVLQERAFGRLGSSGEDVLSVFQLISATNSDPQELVAAGRLREDFLDRIAAVTISTPPLRSCPLDLPLLANHFLRKLVGEKKRISPAAMSVMGLYHWPGNVRELQRAIQEAVVRSEDAAIVGVEHLPARVVTASPEGQIESSTDRRARAGRPPTDWHRQRLLSELRIAVDAKRAIAAYKGQHWKAEFMRAVYPHAKAQNAKGFSDVIKRLTKGPWGDPDTHDDPEISQLLRDLLS
jgi:DNA-binding NtrC family response regulator